MNSQKHERLFIELTDHHSARLYTQLVGNLSVQSWDQLSIKFYDQISFQLNRQLCAPLLKELYD